MESFSLLIVGDYFIFSSLCLDFDCLIDNGLIRTIDLATIFAIF
jgi:hypothetical protein